MPDKLFENDDIRVVKTVIQGDETVERFTFEKNDGIDALEDNRWKEIFHLDNGDLNSDFDYAAMGKPMLTNIAKSFTQAIDGD